MKSAAERGSIGAWAYEARADADLSVEEVAERLARAGQPVRPATIRGIEGGSKQPSMRLLRAMAKVYGTTPPNERAGSVTSGGTDPASYLARVDALVGLVQQLVDQNAELLSKVKAPPPPLALGRPSREQVDRDLDRAIAGTAPIPGSRRATGG